jgi:hypothetical protein
MHFSAVLSQENQCDCMKVIIKCSYFERFDFDIVLEDSSIDEIQIETKHEWNNVKVNFYS